MSKQYKALVPAVVAIAIGASSVRAQDAGFRALEDIDRSARISGPPPVITNPPKTTQSNQTDETDQSKKPLKKKQPTANN